MLIRSSTDAPTLVPAPAGLPIPGLAGPGRRALRTGPVAASPAVPHPHKGVP